MRILYKITTAPCKLVEHNSYSHARNPTVIPALFPVIPAKAGIHCGTDVPLLQLQPIYRKIYEIDFELDR